MAGVSLLQVTSPTQTPFPAQAHVTRKDGGLGLWLWLQQAAKRSCWGNPSPAAQHFLLSPTPHASTLPALVDPQLDPQHPGGCPKNARSWAGRSLSRPKRRGFSEAGLEIHPPIGEGDRAPSPRPPLGPAPACTPPLPNAGTAPARSPRLAERGHHHVAAAALERGALRAQRLRAARFPPTLGPWLWRGVGPPRSLGKQARS